VTAAQLWRPCQPQGVQNPLAACQGEMVPGADPRFWRARSSLDAARSRPTVGSPGSAQPAVAPGGVVKPAAWTGRCRPLAWWWTPCLSCPPSAG
jgi:hypothetical protein